MKDVRSKWVITATLTLLIAMAAGPLAQARSPMKGRRFGAVFGLYADPFPMDFGLSIHFRVSNVLRFNVGWGSTFTKPWVYAAGAGMKVHPLPSWSVAPVLGLGFSRTFGGNSRTVVVTNLTGADLEYQAGSNFLTGTAGIHWYKDSGFILETGYTYAVIPSRNGLIYLSFGKFF